MCHYGIDEEQACLLGENCKYNVGNNENPAVLQFLQGKDVIPICPEMLAGMGCPRTPIEIVDGVLMDRDDNNVDAAIRKAVDMALEQIAEEELALAILQSRSPTCGVKEVYGGSFSGRKIPGFGIFAKRLCASGYRVMDVEDVPGETY